MARIEKALKVIFSPPEYSSFDIIKTPRYDIQTRKEPSNYYKSLRKLINKVTSELLAYKIYSVK